MTGRPTISDMALINGVSLTKFDAWGLASVSPPAYTDPTDQAQTQEAEEEEGDPDWLFYVYYYGCFMVMTLVGTCGNIIVIYAIRRYHHLRTPSNCLILSLACSDLCLGLLYSLYNISHLHFNGIRQTLGEWPVCIIVFWGTLGFLFLSAYTLVAITVIRFISISDPLRFADRVTTGRAKIVVAFLWVFSLSLSAVLYVRPKPGNYEHSCRYEEILSLEHVYINTTVTVLAPMIIMLAIWIKMTLIAKKQARLISAQQLGPTHQAAMPSKIGLIAKELKMFKMAALLVGYFAFAWSPFLVYQFVSFTCKSCNPNNYLRATVRLILHSNEAVNVLIYAGRLPEFRWAFKRLFHKLTCTNNRVSPSSDDDKRFSRLSTIKVPSSPKT